MVVEAASRSKPVLVNESVKCKTVPPAGGEVTDIDVSISGCLHLTPQQQRVLCRLNLAAVHLFYRYVLDLYGHTHRHAAVNHTILDQTHATIL